MTSAPMNDDRPCLNIFRSGALIVLVGSRKKKILCGPATNAFSPPPLGLLAIGTFFLTLKKVLFPLVAHPFSPPTLLAARPLRKELFLLLPYVEMIIT